MMSEMLSAFLAPSSPYLDPILGHLLLQKPVYQLELGIIDDQISKTQNL